MTTVSRALNGYSDVSPTTRERVVEAARALGYMPNSLARRLSSGRAECIGFVMEEVNVYYGDPYFTQLISGIGEVLGRANLDLVISGAASRDDQLPAYRRLVGGRRVDGLILDRTRSRDPRVGFLLDQGFPFVTLGRDDRADEHAWVDVDGAAAFREMTRHLIRLGHRRIGFVGADQRYHFVADRNDGYLVAMAEAGLPVEPAWRADGDLSEGGGAEAARRLLSLPEPLTAIVCLDDLTAMGALRAARACGRRVGTDLSVTGYNDLNLALHADPPLTTSRMPIREAGQRLAQMLLQVLNGTAPASLQELWTSTLQIRQSTAPCREREALRA